MSDPLLWWLLLAGFAAIVVFPLVMGLAAFALAYGWMRGTSHAIIHTTREFIAADMNRLNKIMNGEE